MHEQRIQKHKQEHLRKKVGIKDVGAKGIGVVAKVCAAPPSV